MKMKIILLASLISAFLTGCKITETPTPDPCDAGKERNFCTFDALHQDMVKRVGDTLITTDDLQIVVSEYGFDVGTVILISEDRKKVSIESDDACAPSKKMIVRPANKLFPPSVLSKSASAGIGLNDKIISAVASAGVTVSENRKIVFSVKDTSAVMLSNEDLRQVLKKPRCKSNLAASSAVMVRGYIQGQRDFRITRALKGDAKLSLVKVGNFTITGGLDKSATLTDSKPERFIMLISAVKMGKPKPTGGWSDTGMIERKVTRPEFEKPEMLKGVTLLEIERQVPASLPTTNVITLSPDNEKTKITDE